MRDEFKLLLFCAFVVGPFFLFLASVWSDQQQSEPEPSCAIVEGR